MASLLAPGRACPPDFLISLGWVSIEDLASWVAGVTEFSDASDNLADDPEWAAEHATDNVSF